MCFERPRTRSMADEETTPQTGNVGPAGQVDYARNMGPRVFQPPPPDYTRAMGPRLFTPDPEADARRMAIYQESIREREAREWAALMARTRERLATRFEKFLYDLLAAHENHQEIQGITWRRSATRSGRINHEPDRVVIDMFTAIDANIHLPVNDDRLTKCLKMIYTISIYVRMYNAFNHDAIINWHFEQTEAANLRTRLSLSWQQQWMNHPETLFNLLKDVYQRLRNTNTGEEARGVQQEPLFITLPSNEELIVGDQLKFPVAVRYADEVFYAAPELVAVSTAMHRREMQVLPTHDHDEGAAERMRGQASFNEAILIIGFVHFITVMAAILFNIKN